MAQCHKTGLVEKYGYGDFLYFKLMISVPFITGMIAIIQHASSYWWAVGYLAMVLWHVNITYATFCPHCPYYIRSEKTCKCVMIWGVPKLYKNKPWPASNFVSYFIVTDIALTSLYPAYWVWQDMRFFTVYWLSLSVFLVSLLKNECTRCIWFDCKKNMVPVHVREEYLKSHGAQPMKLVNTVSSKEVNIGG